MTEPRVHITEAAPDPAPRRTFTERSGWVSPAAQRHAEMLAAIEADNARDRYQPPTTRAELLAMRSDDQVRTYREHREVYDRLMGHTPPTAPAGGE
ncbi:hypothetical protein ACFY3J_37060 [Streptomyces sp. NPDC001231]|uniref:hypothetical protein n=1 Tax=unclassified Streptomyces TaxID=2593676 RepID=UPI0036A7399C